ncbi:hypothetical protein EC991_003815 [Linnemannia zychae]|nr:hypothetical protein EC991_003815 [Linnemannia zychae]
MNLKRGIAIRKENLKQRNYYSKLMTDDLKDIEQVNLGQVFLQDLLQGLETDVNSDGSYEPSSELSSQDIYQGAHHPDGSTFIPKAGVSCATRRIFSVRG